MSDSLPSRPSARSLLLASYPALPSCCRCLFVFVCVCVCVVVCVCVCVFVCFFSIRLSGVCPPTRCPFAVRVAYPAYASDTVSDYCFLLIPPLCYVLFRPAFPPVVGTAPLPSPGRGVSTSSVRLLGLTASYSTFLVSARAFLLVRIVEVSPDEAPSTPALFCCSSLVLLLIVLQLSGPASCR